LQLLSFAPFQAPGWAICKPLAILVYCMRAKETRKKREKTD
jgi:hypothetical protein